MVTAAIRYFHCVNSSSGADIYPQLRQAGNTGNVVWDGRNVSTSYLLNEGQSDTVDLSNINWTPQDFVLSCDVVWGDDDWDGNYSFSYDANSTLMATGHKYGGLRDGGFTYDGVKAFSAEADQKERATRPPPLISHFDYVTLDATSYDGTLLWPSGLNPLPPSTTVLYQLEERGYRVSFKLQGATTKFSFKSKGNKDVSGEVPAKVKADWEESIKQALSLGAKDEGVVVGVILGAPAKASGAKGA